MLILFHKLINNFFLQILNQVDRNKLKNLDIKDRYVLSKALEQLKNNKNNFEARNTISTILDKVKDKRYQTGISQDGKFF